MQALYNVEDDLFQAKLSFKSIYYNLPLLHSFYIFDITYLAQSKNQELENWIQFNELEDLKALDHASNNLKGCIYSIIEESVHWNSSIAVAIQSGSLDQDLEHQDWKIQTSVDQKYFSRGFSQTNG